MSEDEERGFKISDRRRFDAEGAEREGVEEDPGARQASTGEDEPEAKAHDLPAMDFSTFVLSLCTSAMVHLGQAPHPDGTTRTDLAFARQTIDILAMLQAKTTGNLTEEEGKMLDEVLYDLRLRFVAARR